jgi:hypothetical protein
MTEKARKRRGQSDLVARVTAPLCGAPGTPCRSRTDRQVDAPVGAIAPDVSARIAPPGEAFRRNTRGQVHAISALRDQKSFRGAAERRPRNPGPAIGKVTPSKSVLAGPGFRVRAFGAPRNDEIMVERRGIGVSEAVVLFRPMGCAPGASCALLDRLRPRRGERRRVRR